MSHEKLQELERRFRESKQVGDEVAWLRERVTLGDLTQERLELAAYCAHPAAERACGIMTSSATPSLEEMTRNLASFQDPAQPVALVAARCVSSIGVDGLGQAPEALTRAVAGILEFERCPCEAHRSGLFVLSSQLGRLAATRLSGNDPRLGYAVKAAYHLCLAINHAAKAKADQALEQLKKGLAESRRAGLEEKNIAGAVRSGLLDWALAPSN